MDLATSGQCHESSPRSTWCSTLSVLEACSKEPRRLTGAKGEVLVPAACCAGRFHPSLARVGVPFLTSLPRTVPGIGKASMRTGLF